MGKKNPDGLFDSMVREAMEEVGNDGWKNATDKAVTLAAFGMLAEKIDRKISSIVKPAWIIALSAAGTALWFLISKVIGID